MVEGVQQGPVLVGTFFRWVLNGYPLSSVEIPTGTIERSPWTLMGSSRRRAGNKRVFTRRKLNHSEGFNHRFVSHPTTIVHCSATTW